MINHSMKLSLLLALFVFTNASNAFAQPNWPNLAEAEGELVRRHRQHGINRRVAIEKPQNSANLGYYSISAHFDVGVNLVTDDEIESRNPGQLPNKPTCYFGIIGPGRFWFVPEGAEIEDGEWRDSNTVEIDAGLEYDSRPEHEGWRAFISVNRVQTNYTYITDGIYNAWRGKGSSYDVTFSINDDGIPVLKVEEEGESPIEFTWNPENQRNTGESVFETRYSRNRTAKRVVGNTRPASDNDFTRDGSTFSCTTKDCTIYYAQRVDGKVGNVSKFLAPIYPNDPEKEYHFKVHAEDTGHDTPLTGPDSYDSHAPNGRPSDESRRILDFYQLDGATPLQVGGQTFPNLYDIGRKNGSYEETQDGISRYQQETVRVNLRATKDVQGTLVFVSSGETP